jgi:hypothetical protein
MQIIQNPKAHFGAGFTCLAKLCEKVSHTDVISGRNVERRVMRRTALQLILFLECSAVSDTCTQEVANLATHVQLFLSIQRLLDRLVGVTFYQRSFMCCF